MIPQWFRNRDALLCAGVFLLLLNTAYLAAFAQPTLFYFANVVLHIVLGVAVAIPLARRLAAHRRAVPVVLLVAAALAAAGTLAGIAIAVVGAAGRFRWLLPVHIALILAGTIPWLAFGAWAGARRRASGERLALGAAYAMAVTALLGAPAVAWRGGSADRERYRIVNPALVPASMDDEGAGPKSPFFPSSANTNVAGTIPANFFMTSESCGRCHTRDLRAVELVDAPLLVVQQPVVPQVDRVHAGRGRHAAVEVVRGLPRPRRLLQRPLRPADQGADRHAGGAGGARLHLVPLDHPRQQHDGPGRLRRSSIRRCTTWRPARTRCSEFVARPADSTSTREPHRETSSSRSTASRPPEFCSSCHKVHLDVPVNSYRWFRGFNDYDNWQASGVSGEGARSFYYPPKPQKCADCHMPLVRVERSGGQERQDPLAPLPRREHRAARS